MGWEPGEVTSFEYDDDGRLVRAVTVREAEFSDWDRAVLLADSIEKARPRGGHGLLISEATDPANQFAFETPNPVQDWAQKSINDKQAEYRKANPNADMGSLLWRTNLR